MAKKKESLYKNWEEIDNQLKKIGELKIEKTKLEGELTLKTNELKNCYSTKCEAIAKEIKTIEKEITRYCEQNKDSFINKRNKKLNFGTIAYRLSEKIVCPCDEAAIKALKALNLDYCLRIKEEIDKDKLKELDAKILTKIGATVVKEDKITIEPNIIEIVSQTK